MAAAGGDGSGSPQPARPAAIVRLDDSVVHRIAAGEVVQRPASALKEMLENSLDAGARHITVVVKEGGLKYLQIQDDGCGVRLEDLPILCHRHTTSKLRAYEDLDTIATLGFRGEALASISFVSHVTVTTMTAGLQHGYRAKYSDGEMLPPGPKPAAAVPGTSIIVEDMFYNMLPRRRAFRPGPEEHNLLLDVLQKYAIYKAGSVGFTLKRQGESRSDLHTLPSSSRLDVIRGLFGPDLAAALLPLQLSGGAADLSDAVPLDGAMAFSAQGFVSNLTLAGRKSVLILFINGRPVEHGQLKRALEATYTAHNPKANKPWVFLELRLPPRHVEVNIHPTKKEVGFLHQQDIIDAICRAVEQLLLQSMNSRTFTVNRPAALAAAAGAGGAGTGAAADGEADEGGDAGEEGQPTAATQQQQQQPPGTQRQRPGSARSAGGSQQQTQPQQTQSTYRPQKLVRTDHRAQTLDGFFVSQASAAAVASAAAPVPARRRSAAARAGRQSQGAEDAGGLFSSDQDGDGLTGGGSEPFSNAALYLQAAAAEEAAAAAELQAAGGEQQQQQGTQAAAGQQQLLMRMARQPKLPAVVTQLSSVRELLGEVAAAAHAELEQLFREHTWVGMADDSRVLLQHGTRLYLVDAAAVSRDLCYQLLLSRWQACTVMRLAAPLPVGQLMDAALQLEEAAGRWKPEPGSSRRELCGMVEALLAQKAQMLQEYTGLVFTTDTAHRQQQQQQQEEQQEEQQEVPGQLCLAGLPLLLDGYVPDLSCLPRLVLQLARDVDWDTEQECFRSLAGVVAGFYALQPLLQPAAAGDGRHASGTQQQQHATGRTQEGCDPMEVDGGAADAADAAAADAAQQQPAEAAGLLGAHRCQQQREWLLRHVVMPAVKHMYRPPRDRARDGSVLLLTSMEKLYRVFERCGW